LLLLPRLDGERTETKKEGEGMSANQMSPLSVSHGKKPEYDPSLTPWQEKEVRTIFLWVKKYHFAQGFFKKFKPLRS
jgi:hypothetical protein